MSTKLRDAKESAAGSELLASTCCSRHSITARALSVLPHSHLLRFVCLCPRVDLGLSVVQARRPYSLPSHMPTPPRLRLVHLLGLTEDWEREDDASERRWTDAVGVIGGDGGGVEDSDKGYRRRLPGVLGE